MSAISITHATKRYGNGYLGIDDVSLEIDDGEFMILVGPSGSGKSTLLQMIVGLEDITDGGISIGGNRVNDKSPRDRNLAMVFQNYALYPHLTVFENIAFPLRLRNLSDAEVKKRVEGVAEELQLTEFLDQKPAALSGGQRQRVATGRAVVREAAAYLFDEPLSNLDAKLRGEMRTNIARLQKKLAATMVYVTHDQVEAMTLGDRLAVLRKGKLLQVGSPRELYDRPVNLFVAGFIGSPPMNFLPAAVHADHLETPLAMIPFDARRLPKGIGRADHLVAGIRPDHVRLAATLDANRRRSSVSFKARVDVVEWLGDEQLVYVPFEAPEQIEQLLTELARELDSQDPKTQLIAKLGAESAVTEGGEIELALDPGELLLFDTSTGDRVDVDLR
jgi:multiple sugar transport system ATP-binding protein